MGIRDEVERLRDADRADEHARVTTDAYQANLRSSYEAEIRRLAGQFGQWALATGVPPTVTEGALRKRHGWVLMHSVGATWKHYVAVMADGEVRFDWSGHLDHISVEELKTSIARRVAAHGSEWPFDS